jgi:4'-phosphopantetheinyl transferase
VAGSGVGVSVRAQPTWEGAPLDAALRPDEAHVFRFALALGPDALRRHEGLLAADERARAARFVLQVHRDRFIAGRAMLRRVLGSYLGAPPEAVELVLEAGGKPSLAGNRPLRFNLSHSGGLALLAVALDRDVGVDLESLRADVAILDLAERFFSRCEREELLSVPSEGRLAAFFACWTRKEAFLKARGDGLGLPLDSFDVTVRPGEPPRVLRTDLDPLDAARFSLLDLPPIPGFASALAVRGDAPRLRCFATDQFT